MNYWKLPLGSLGSDVPDEDSVVPASGEEDVGVVFVVLAAVDSGVVAGSGRVGAGEREHLLLRLVVEDLDLHLSKNDGLRPAHRELGRARVEVDRVQLRVQVPLRLYPAQALPARHVPFFSFIA